MPSCKTGNGFKKGATNRLLPPIPRQNAGQPAARGKQPRFIINYKQHPRVHIFPFTDITPQAKTLMPLPLYGTVHPAITPGKPRWRSASKIATVAALARLSELTSGFIGNRKNR